MSNIVTAAFGSGCGYTTTENLWQYDYGQILQITGLDLPDAYQVHFCNKGDLTTIEMIGDAGGVTIPDNLLENGTPINAYIYLHTGTDDGETEYKITIPVNQRPEPSDEQPTPAQQSAIDAAIAALNSAIEAAGDAAQAILDMGVDASTLTAGSSATVTKTVDAQGVVTLTFGIPRGDTGETGDDGFSPTVTVTEISGGHRITITDANGSQSFDVLNGDAGITIDDALSNTSVHPVQNKVITAALAGKADASTIPSKTSDLTNDSGFVNASGAAAAAPVQSVNGKTGTVVLSASDVGAGTYSKPSGGIPKSDLASAVQTSLGKADTALQSAPVTSVNGQTGDVTVDVPTKTSDLTNDSGFLTSAPVTSVAGKTGAVALDKSDVGLGNVDNTSDANKPISTATQTALNGKANVLTEQTITTAGAVTQALTSGVLYHFTGALTALTITLTAPASGVAHYHFDFLSGATAPTLTMPSTVTMPDDFAVEASKRYEVDVLNNFGAVVSWTV